MRNFILKENKILFLLILNIAILIYACANINISYDEAQIYFSHSSFLRKQGFLHELTGLSMSAFGDILGLDFAIRMPFVCAHLINLYLFYLLSRKILISHDDSILSVMIFMFLPGVLASAVLVNNAVFIIMLSLGALLCFSYSRFKTLIFLLALSIFISNAFITLYLALFFYALYTKNRAYGVLGAIFILAWLFVFDFEISGKPRGYLLDTMAIYAAVFSPFIFIYFIYALYRIWVKESKDFLWFISCVAFCLSLIISVRAKAPLEAFLPFCVIFLPQMLRLFLNSMRVRLPAFRTKYKILGAFLLFSLILQNLASIFNAPLYLLNQNAKNHFMYNYDIAKELATKLKQNDVYSVYTSDEKLRVRLKFYGIDSSFKARLSTQQCAKNASKISIEKLGKQIALFYLCK